MLLHHPHLAQLHVNQQPFECIQTVLVANKCLISVLHSFLILVMAFLMDHVLCDSHSTEISVLSTEFIGSSQQLFSKKGCGLKQQLLTKFLSK